MINLLPEETKNHIKAARSNYIFVRYVIVVAISALFLLGASFVSYSYLENIINNPQSTTPNNNLTGNQNDTSNSDLTKINSIMNNQISYSKIISSLMSSVPENVTIESPVDIKSNTINTPIKLKAYLKSNTDEIQLRQKFENSMIFTNYTAQESEKNTSSNSNNYPFVVNFSITINTELVK